MQMQTPTPIQQALSTDARIQQLTSLLSDDVRQQLFLVGGAVRDALKTGQLPDDLDIITLHTPAAELSAILAGQLKGTRVTLHEDLGMYRVVWPTHSEAPETKEAESHTSAATWLDISDALGGNLATDLARRDLTCNAMAVGLDGTHWQDPYNGQADLSSGTIRAISRSNLAEDPLRLLRVFRFAATLGARQIENDTLTWVKELAPTLTKAAPERLHTEWLKMLSAPHSYQWLTHMGHTGLLEVLIPELTATRRIPPNSHHHLDLWHHTLELVNQLENTVIPGQPESWQAYIAQPIYNHTAGITRKGLLVFGCLLHDIAKPDTHLIIEETGRHTFHGHDKVGEEKTLALCKRLKTGGTIARHVAALVRWHLYPYAFTPQSAPKSLLKFYRRMGTLAPDLLLLAMADRLSTRGPEVTQATVDTELANLQWLLDAYPDMQVKEHVPPLLSGHDVMTLLNLSEGRTVGHWLNEVRERQLLGELTTTDEAKTWLLKHASATPAL